ncbi:hypothetical protein DSL72_004647 [Monilinia vaccinii-corymbosi]|uniref:Uncharacterized protein n=1 Tax=Monilinia vaccinii-corymbosi TaxID=61207 RepID=A0A8A3P9Y1_9HELO|nr:hypothetical protein DSL72_004647 [Monilinia vaccinii-corymbosi]
MLRLGIIRNDSNTPDSDSGSKGKGSSITSASSSLSASQPQSQTESTSEINTDATSDDSDIEPHSSPPISMLINATNSGLSPDAGADCSDPATESDDEEGLAADANSVSPAGTEVHGGAESGTPISSLLGIAGAADAHPVPSDILALKGSMLLLSPTSVGPVEIGVESSVSVAESGARTPNSAALQAKSLPGGFIASAPAAEMNESLAGGALRMGRERGLGLELGWGGRLSGIWLVLVVCFVVWRVL